MCQGRSSVQTQEQETREPAHQCRGRHRRSDLRSSGHRPAGSQTPRCRSHAHAHALMHTRGGEGVRSQHAAPRTVLDTVPPSGRPSESGHGAGTTLALEWPAPCQPARGPVLARPVLGGQRQHARVLRVTRSGMRGSAGSEQPRRRQTSGGRGARGLRPPSLSRGLAHANTSPCSGWCRQMRKGRGGGGGGGGLRSLRPSQQLSDSLSWTALPGPPQGCVTENEVTARPRPPGSHTPCSLRGPGGAPSLWPHSDPRRPGPAFPGAGASAAGGRVWGAEPA